MAINMYLTTEYNIQIRLNGEYTDVSPQEAIKIAKQLIDIALIATIEEQKTDGTTNYYNPNDI